MSTEPSNTNEPSAGDFSLDLGDDILAAALDAVEARAKKTAITTEVDEFMADLAIAETETDSILLESEPMNEIELHEGANEDISVADALVFGEGESSNVVNAQLQSLEKPDIDPEIDILADLEKAKSQRERAIHKYKVEAKQRRKLEARLARYTEQLKDAESAAQSARDSRDTAEDLLQSAKIQLSNLTNDFSRQKSRHERDLVEANFNAVAPTIMAVLPILDNLEMAILHVGEDPSRVIDGVKMTTRQFAEALSKLGVVKIKTEIGTEFSPELHEAVQTAVSNDLPSGSIMAEHTAGYLLDNRLIRAARVTVSTHEATVATQDLTDNYSDSGEE